MIAFYVVVSSTVSFLNTLLGTGLLNIPYAMASSGPLLGSIFLMICAFLSITTSRFLVYAAHEEYGKSQTKPFRRTPLLEVGEVSYGSLAKIAFGNLGAFLVDLIVAVTCFGFAVNCLIEFGDVFPKFITGMLGVPQGLLPWYQDLFYDRDFWIFMCLVCVLPICLEDTVDNFAWFSSVCLGCSGYLILLVLYLCISPGSHVTSVNPLHPNAPLSWTESFPIYIFAFTCHQNLFSVHKEIGAMYVGSSIPRKTMSTLHDMITYASVACALLYLVIGLLGYRSFGSHVDVIILNNFDPSPSLVLARFLSSVLSALTFTLQIQPCKASLDGCLIPLIQKHYHRGQHSFTFVEFLVDDEGRKRGLTLFLFILCYITAIQVNQIDRVLYWVGATGGVLICYILPCAFYILLVYRRNK